MIKGLVEKLYYRVFPDRINEHALAQMLIPVVEEKRYRPEKMITEYRVPRELIGSDELPIEWIKEHLDVIKCSLCGYVKHVPDLKMAPHFCEDCGSAMELQMRNRKTVQYEHR